MTKDNAELTLTQQVVQEHPEVVVEKYGTDIGHAAAMVRMWDADHRRLEGHIMEGYIQGILTESQARDALKAIGTKPSRIAVWFEQNPINDERDTYRRRGYQLVANDPNYETTFAEREAAHRAYEEVAAKRRKR